MIRYLFSGAHAYTLNTLLAGFGRETASRFELIAYPRLLRRSRLPVGTYIFSDIERLCGEELERAGRAWQALAASGGGTRLLNHPLETMRRYELLRTLYEAGINRFNVYRLTECRRPERFPVFIRVENDHRRSETPLLHTQGELDDAVGRMLSRGRSREGRIVTEYCHTAPDGRGYYRKYGAFVVAGEIIPAHVIFGDSWVVQMTKVPFDSHLIREIERFLGDDSHLDQLRRVASLARVDYGRIDYALVDGRVQVFEVNTNPSFPRIDPSDPPGRIRLNRRVNERIMKALLAVDSPEPKGRTVAFRVEAETLLWRWRYLPYEAAHVLTRPPVLRRFEPALFWHLKRLAKKTYLRHHDGLVRKRLINP